MKKMAVAVLLLSGLSFSQIAGAAQFHSIPTSPAACKVFLQRSAAATRAKYHLKDTDALNQAQIFEAEHKTPQVCFSGSASVAAAKLLNADVPPPAAKSSTTAASSTSPHAASPSVPASAPAAAPASVSVTSAAAPESNDTPKGGIAN